MLCQLINSVNFGLMSDILVKTNLFYSLLEVLLSLQLQKLL